VCKAPILSGGTALDSEDRIAAPDCPRQPLLDISPARIRREPVPELLDLVRATGRAQ
jgi:hypothetical protein